jgi:hypothetical protein
MPTPNNLRIENPCPFVPTRMNKHGANFFCKSCSKTIVDYRSKTIDEIKCAINKDTCGIFTADQLPGQQQMSFSRTLLFYCFTVLSLLGFSVGPLPAQTTQTKKDTISVNTKSGKQPSAAANKTNLKNANTKTETKGLFHRKKKYRVTGCPEF